MSEPFDPNWPDDPNEESDNGDLDWLSDMEPSESEDVGKPLPDDAFDFDALTSPKPEDTEDTGEWLGELADDPFDVKPAAPAQEEETPDWLKTQEGMPSLSDLVASSEDTPEVPQEEESGLPDWLRTDESYRTAMEDEPDADASEPAPLAPWLVGQDIEDDEEEAGEEEGGGPLPIWLQGADDLGAADANAFQASFDDLQFEVEEPPQPAVEVPAAEVSSEDTGWVQESDELPDLDALLMESDEETGSTEEFLSSLLAEDAAAPGDVDLLGMLTEETIPDEEAAKETVPPVSTDEFQSLLFGDEDDALFDSNPIDFDALLGEGPYTSGDELERAELSDILSDASVSGASAAALLRQQQDVPLEDLPEDLLALREDSLAASAAATSTVVPAIPTAPRAPSAPSRGLTDAQRRSAELLRSIAAATTPDTAAQIKPVRRRVRYNVPRLLVAALLVAAVVLPFFDPFQWLRFAPQPPVLFSEDSPAEAAYALLDTTQAGDLALIAVDSSAGTLSELNEALSGVMTHLFARGVTPVIVSTDPVTLVAVERMAARLAPDTVGGPRFVVGPYLVGESVGVRGLVENAPDAFAFDRDGQPSGLAIGSLNDFAAIVIVTDRADGVRMWAEQIAPVVSSPMVFAVAAGAAPLAEVYADSLGVPLLIGMRDGMTYVSQLGSYIESGRLIPFSAEPTETETPAPTETPEETATPEPDATGEGAIIPLTQEATEPAAPTPTPSPRPTETTAPTDTPVPPTNTAAPSSTPQPSSTPPPTNTVPPTNTPAPTATIEGAMVAVVIADQRINVRTGPSTNFPVIGSAGPGERLPVLGFNDDGTWVNVEISGGREGWVSRQLVRIEGGSVSLRIGMGAQQAQLVTAQTVAERRWYGVTSGAVVAALLIALGSLVGIVRGLARRRR